MQPEFRTDNFNRNIELKGVEGRGHFEIPFFSMSREKARKFWLCFFFTFFFGGGGRNPTFWFLGIVTTTKMRWHVFFHHQACGVKALCSITLFWEDVPLDQ